ncbi:hypothetical protein ACTQ50_19505, partial [Blautia sp. Sow4_E7]|uniref:hypothetical protein n=1 Tax=Blautia sp. Sow4_E7 TaxID=3438749 RepID=UPI003F91CA19
SWSYLRWVRDIESSSLFSLLYMNSLRIRCQLYLYNISIALVQTKASPKTKQRAEAKGIKLYDDLSPEKVKEVREKVKKRKTGGNNNA